MFDMARREFIVLLGGGLACPLAARAQPLPAIGFLHSGSPRACRAGQAHRARR
jgi:hypothetical protein